MLKLFKRLLFGPPPPKEGTAKGFRWTLMDNDYRQYYCKECDTPLAPGPEGCGSLNAVCRNCKVNHGCLPKFWDRP